MKKVLLLSLTLILISGCGASAQEKRNNFDACTIEYMSRQPQSLEGFDYKLAADNAESFCVKFLK